MKIFLSEVGWVLMSFLGGSLFRVFQFEILLHKLGNQNVASNFGTLCYFPPFRVKNSDFHIFQRHLMFESFIGIVLPSKAYYWVYFQHVIASLNEILNQTLPSDRVILIIFRLKNQFS